MFVAYDKDGNRVYADETSGDEVCRCPVCNERVRLRKGSVYRAHFAHLPKSSCSWGKDKDHMSEWHIRMQSYFPKESIEYRFKDNETGEVHIADVFDEKSNTVIEFQKSKISDEEFTSRCAFHINNGRRIAWIFDESATNSKENAYGRLGKNNLMPASWPYEDLWFKWLRRPRKCLLSGPDIYRFADVYSVFLYTGTEGDIVHRIVSEDFDYEYIMLSIHNVSMNGELTTDELFYTDTYWSNQPPWKDLFDIKRLQMEQCETSKQEEFRVKLRQMKSPRRNWRL